MNPSEGKFVLYSLYEDSTTLYKEKEFVNLEDALKAREDRKSVTSYWYVTNDKGEFQHDRNLNESIAISSITEIKER